MTRIYEALERLEHRNSKEGADKEKLSGRTGSVPEKRRYEVLHPISVFEDNDKQHARELRGIYSGMLFRIEGKLKQNGRGNVVQIVGSRPGEGTSTVARELARAAVRDFGRTVLLIDMDSLEGSRLNHFAGPDVRRLPGGVPGVPMPRDIIRSDDETLHMTSLSSTDVVRISSPENGTGSALERLERSYDMVIIDSPPMERNQANPFFPLADAIVLVVEAEKTRHQVVRRSKECIERQGGNLIGIVLNKKEFHVPEWLYKRL